MPRDKGDGGPAFPRPISHTQGEVYEAQDGLSLRDYLAAKIAPTLKWYSYEELTAYREKNKKNAGKCYLIADALLEAREEKKDA